MKQGPLSIILIGILALVVSLISSNKIVQEQTLKAKRQALSIRRAERDKLISAENQSNMLQKYKLGPTRESGQ